MATKVRIRGKSKEKKKSPAKAAKNGMKAATKSPLLGFRAGIRKASGPLAKRGGKATVSKPKAVVPPLPALAGSGIPLPTAVPTQAEISTEAAALSGAAAAAFENIMTSLAEHLGSPEAARLWLVTPSPQFDARPLDAILAGEAENVLAYLESRWGPGPVYA